MSKKEEGARNGASTKIIVLSFAISSFLALCTVGLAWIVYVVRG